ncbi:MAG: HPr family phosphocarrier protein [bacterium]|nr:HPr family phosphocarrier protein [bacterium]
MVERELEVINRLGLHARAAAKFVHLAGSFGCRVMLSADGQKVDGKSILGILLLAAAQGTMLTISCDGNDEGQALAELSELVTDKFGEGS